MDGSVKAMNLWREVAGDGSGANVCGHEPGQPCSWLPGRLSGLRCPANGLEQVVRRDVSDHAGGATRR